MLGMVKIFLSFIIEKQTCWVIDIFVCLICLKVRKWRCTSGGIWHDFETTVYQTLLVNLFENPPNGFHEFGVQGFVVILEVDPSSC